MITETRYICEVCGEAYQTEKRAIACEARPRAPIYPAGLIFQYDDKGGCFLAIGCNWISDQKRLGHYNNTNFWACRSWGDSLGKEMCGHEYDFAPNTSREFDKRWLDNHNFQRLAAWLRANGHTPTVWISGTVVPLDEVKP